MGHKAKVIKLMDFADNDIKDYLLEQEREVGGQVPDFSIGLMWRLRGDLDSGSKGESSESEDGPEGLTYICYTMP